MKKKGCAQHGFNVFGMTVVGERGQVVIPAEARKAFKINKGDKFLVMSGGPGHMVSLLPLESIGIMTDKFKEFVERVETELNSL